jgi:hypothetical protein
MVKMYLAGRYERRHELSEYAEALRRFGHEVTSEWLLGKHEAINNSASPSERDEWANDDIADIFNADMLVLFTDKPGDAAVSGGKDTEFGIAMARRKRLAIVGPRRNIFHYMNTVRHFQSVGDFLAEFAREAASDD